MTEIERLADQLRRAHEGNAWHGPAVAEILADVSSSGAAARPTCGQHSIWELLGHIAAWEKVVCRRLVERVPIQPTPEENFPPVSDASEAAWKRTQMEADHTYRELHVAIRRLRDEDLEAMIPGGDASLYVLLHGAVQHTLYHAGQMALLKRGPGRA